MAAQRIFLAQDDGPPGPAVLQDRLSLPEPFCFMISEKFAWEAFSPFLQLPRL
jgi:hypothetical protein